LIGTIRLFWAANKLALGGLTIASLIGALATAAFAEFGPKGSVVGEIVSFGIREGRTGSHRVAVIRVNSASTQLHLPSSSNCDVGDKIHLTERRGLIGAKYSVTTAGEICS